MHSAGRAGSGPSEQVRWVILVRLSLRYEAAPNGLTGSTCAFFSRHPLWFGSSSVWLNTNLRVARRKEDKCNNDARCTPEAWFLNKHYVLGHIPQEVGIIGTYSHRKSTKESQKNRTNCGSRLRPASPSPVSRRSSQRPLAFGAQVSPPPPSNHDFAGKEDEGSHLT